MDTLAAPEISELEVVFHSTTPASILQLEVVFDSTTPASTRQLRTEDDLYSRGGSAPVELDDSSTEDEEQGHGKNEVEVVMVNSTEPTVTVPEVDDASMAATSAWPPGLPRPNNLLDKIKYDTAIAGVPTGVRTKEKVKPLPVVRLGKDWDRKMKDRLQKERNAKGKSYVIPKLGSTSASPGVGSTPTPALPLSTAAPASGSPAAEVTPTTKDIINRATKDIISKAGNNPARPDKEIPVSKAPPPSNPRTQC
jgi:hypothetical protein